MQAAWDIPFYPDTARRGQRSSVSIPLSVALLAAGLSNPDIARELFISRNTVKVYLSRAYVKLGVANRTELARLAARHSQDGRQC